MRKKKEQNFDPGLWITLFTTLFTTSSNSSNILLEKEVAYLHGKLDVLEKVILNEEPNTVQ